MNKSPSADTRIMSVSIVAGPSAGTLLEQLAAIDEKSLLVLPPGGIPSEGDRAFEQVSAIVEQGEAVHLIIGCDADTPPMAYASLFLSPPLSETARVTKTILAIRPSDLVDWLVRGTGEAEMASPCFLAEQLEFVNRIILDGGGDDPDLKLARTIAKTLNPQAHVSELSRETVKELLTQEGTPFDFAAALDGAGWRQLIEAKEKSPHGEESDVASFGYRARRPFHPEKFLALLQSGLRGVFRAKGFFWLATRMDFVGGLNLAGSELHCAAAGQWWGARDERARQHEMPLLTQKEWQEPFGDRRQAIAFMGFNFDPGAIKAQLDACLLTDSEMSGGPEKWKALPDPFPSWSVHVHTHECDHDHESGDHECCHH
jgi:G3E family GTPase